MKIFLLTMPLLTGAISSCVGAMEDPGPMSERTEAVAAFEQLEVNGAYDVIVTTGGEPGIEMSGPENRLADVRVSQDGDRLVIRQESDGWNMRGDTVEIRVSVPMLSRLSSNGASDVIVNRIEGASFGSSISGAGDIRLEDVDVDELSVSVSGAGDITAAGTAKALSVSLSGAGDFDGPDLVSETASIQIAGVGDIDTQVTGTASGSVAGAGDVRIRGGASCAISEAGAGSVDCS